MNILYLTNNWQLASTARILLSWVTLGRARGFKPFVALQRTGSLAEWLDQRSFEWRLNRMRWPQASRPLAALADLAPLVTWAKRRRIDLIHCNEHDVFPFASRVSRLLGVPIVCHVRFRVARGFCEWAFRGTRCPDALLWTSRQQMQDSADAVAGIVPPERQHLIPLGVDLATFGNDVQSGRALRLRLGISDAEVVLASASALRPIKRVGDFVRLISTLAPKSAVVGVIAGEGMPGDEGYVMGLRKQIAEADLGKRIQLVGHLEPIEPLYQAADIFVSTSEYETFGNSVCEAMACRVPVVGYTGGSVAEILGPAGFIAKTGDFEGLLQHVERLVADPALRHLHGRLGRERVAMEFNPEVTFERLAAVYERLLEARKQ